MSSSTVAAEDMNLSSSSVAGAGECRVPPGFRFHPTEEELLHYYLRKKVAYQKIDLDVIRDVDLNKLEPWDIQERCKIGSTPQNDWYFFSHKDKKYPTGTRTNRATAAGFWKATGRDKVIFSSLRRIGMRKTLVFYKGRAPHGQKSDWIMHEYRLDDHNHHHHQSTELGELQSSGEDGWVVCRVFKKKNYHRTLDTTSPQRDRRSLSLSLLHQSSSSSSTMLNNNNNNHDDDDDDDRYHQKQQQVGGATTSVLDQILLYMGRSCKTEDDVAAAEHQTVKLTTNFPSCNPMITSKTCAGNYDHDHEQLVMGGHAASSSSSSFLHLPRLVDYATTCPTTIAPSSSSLLLPAITQGYSSFKTPPVLINQQYSEEDQQVFTDDQPNINNNNNNVVVEDHGQQLMINDWAALDRLVASQLSGQTAGGSDHAACAADTETTVVLSSSSSYANQLQAAHDDDDFFSFSFDHQEDPNSSGVLKQSSSSSPNSPANKQIMNQVLEAEAAANSTHHHHNNELWSFVHSSSTSTSSSDPLWHLSV